MGLLDAASFPTWGYLPSVSTVSWEGQPQVALILHHGNREWYPLIKDNCYKGLKKCFCPYNSRPIGDFLSKHMEVSHQCDIGPSGAEGAGCRAGRSRVAQLKASHYVKTTVDMCREGMGEQCLFAFLAAILYLNMGRSFSTLSPCWPEGGSLPRDVWHYYPELKSLENAYQRKYISRVKKEKRITMALKIPYKFISVLYLSSL